MGRLATCALAAGVLLLMACTEDAPPQIAELMMTEGEILEPPPKWYGRMDLLAQTAETHAKAFASQEWVVMYSFMPDEFKTKCSLSDFAGMMLYIHSAFGYPEDSKATLTGASASGNYGWADIELEKDGVRLEFPTPDDPATPQFEWHGTVTKWRVHVPEDELAKDNPCVLEDMQRNATP